jgi:hypothetical protein
LIVCSFQVYLELEVSNITTCGVTHFLRDREEIGKYATRADLPDCGGKQANPYPGI